MLILLKIALRNFNNHAGHNCKLMFDDQGVIHIYQTFGKLDCKYWEYIYESFDSIESCIEWLSNN